MIVPIGEWVLEAVCNQINIWDQMRLNQKSVAINVSAMQLRKDDFADTVIDIIKKSNIDPKCLEFELTESSIMTDVDKAVGKLRRLRDIGIKISIDDFGTGFSSLSQLRRFPIDRLKIDKSFISNITNSSDDLIIVSAIINMAKSLNLKITAEGVETKEQLKILTEQGCHEMQGFLYGKPMTEDMIRHYVKYPARTRGTSLLMHPPRIPAHQGRLDIALDHVEVPFSSTPAFGKSNVLPFRTAVWFCDCSDLLTRNVVSSAY
jgi:EAL domain-containing protein (putative c-di-GMP-specific phosphodiesterase class I)